MKTQTVKIIRLQKLCYFAYRFIFSILSLKSCLIYFSSKSSLFFLLHKFSVIIFCAKLLSPNQTIYSIVCDIIVVQVLNLVCVRPHGLQHTKLSCSSPSPRVCSNSCLKYYIHVNLYSIKLTHFNVNLVTQRLFVNL